MLRMHSVSKVYRTDTVETHALREFSLSVAEGEFVSVTGPSGSGKTTLLNLIGSLDVPDEGEVYFNQKKLLELSDGQRADLRLHQIGFVFQAYNLIPVLSARENVEFVMQVQGVRAAERKQQSMKILKEVGLEGMEDRRPAQLSGGQQQRAAIARAERSSAR